MYGLMIKGNDIYVLSINSGALRFIGQGKESIGLAQSMIDKWNNAAKKYQEKVYHAGIHE
jgi:hypothetical protein